MADDQGILGGALASPLLLLGILYYIAENKPQYTGFKSGKELLGIGFGNASSDWITSQVKNMVPGGLGLSDEMVEALAGAMIVKYGGKAHPVVPLLGQGVLIDVVENSLSESGMTLSNLIGGVFGGKQGSSSSEGSTSSSSSESSNPTQNTGQQWVTP